MEVLFDFLVFVNGLIKKIKVYLLLRHKQESKGMMPSVDPTTTLLSVTIKVATKVEILMEAYKEVKEKKKKGNTATGITE